MVAIRRALEEEVLGWPGVASKKMFGCPCYTRKGVIFVFLVTGGVVVTRLDGEQRRRLASSIPAQPFQAGRKSIASWLRIAVGSVEGLGPVLPHVRHSYDNIV